MCVRWASKGLGRITVNIGIERSSDRWVVVDIVVVVIVIVICPHDKNIRADV